MSITIYAPISRHITIVCLGIILLTSCSEPSELSHLGFDRIESVQLKNSDFDIDKLSNPETMHACGDSLLVIRDYYDGKLFSTFDIKTGNLKNRFGVIGNGENEIYLGSAGHPQDSLYVIYDKQKGVVVKYDPAKGNGSYSKLDMTVPEGVDVSRFFLSNDSTVILMGCYNSKYKYVESRNGVVTDSLVLVSDIDNKDLNRIQRFLSEQVNYTASPSGHRLAISTNYTDNVDFISISDHQISTVKSIHLRDASFTPQTFGNNMYRMLPSLDAPIGYIDMTSNNNAVFALYAHHSISDGSYISPYVLVYDWDGNPKRALELSESAYCIAVNDTHLYAVVNDEESGLCKIMSLDLSEIQ